MVQDLAIVGSKVTQLKNKTAQETMKSVQQFVPPDKKPEGSTLHYVRGEERPLQCARGDSLQEEGGVAGSSEAGRDAMEAGEAFWTRVCTDKVINPNFFQIH